MAAFNARCVCVNRRTEQQNISQMQSVIVVLCLSSSRPAGSITTKSNKTTFPKTFVPAHPKKKKQIGTSSFFPELECLLFCLFLFDLRNCV